MSAQSTGEQLVPANRVSGSDYSGRRLLLDARMGIALVVLVFAVGVALLAASGIPLAMLIGDWPPSLEAVLSTLAIASYLALGSFAVLSLLSVVFASRTWSLAIVCTLLSVGTFVFAWSMASYYVWAVGMGPASDQDLLRAFLLVYVPVVIWSVLAGALSARYTNRRLRRWMSERSGVVSDHASQPPVSSSEAAPAQTVPAIPVEAAQRTREARVIGWPVLVIGVAILFLWLCFVILIGDQMFTEIESADDLFYVVAQFIIAPLLVGGIMAAVGARLVARPKSQEAISAADGGQSST